MVDIKNILNHTDSEIHQIFNELYTIINFRSERYYYLNRYRWSLMQKTGIPLKEKIIFEPGAGIGDQTQWLLDQGARMVWVSEGRNENLNIIKKRFSTDLRVGAILGNLENCLEDPHFNIHADLVFMWGVYYHIYDPIPSFPILKKLRRVAPVVVFDYLESATGQDYIERYDYDNPSTSISRASCRPTRETIVNCLRAIYGHCYFPVDQFSWPDPSAPKTPRKIAIGSVHQLDYQGIIEAGG